MDKDIKPEIDIPKAEEKEVFYPSSGRMGAIEKKFEKIDQVLFGVMIAVVLSMIAIIVSVIGLFLDQMRTNNLVYKEYSQKTESVETTQKTNEVLLKQIQDLAKQNNKNQETIIDLLYKQNIKISH